MLSPAILLPVLLVPQTGDHATEIAKHIDSIFRAYIARDREVVLATHTEDWLGYQSRSLHLVRGIDGYMANADIALENGAGWKHEMLEMEPRAYGEIAVCPYVARYFIRQGEQEFTILYRAIDLYRRDGDGWNQCGTNICVVPDEPPAYPSREDFETYPRLRPLAAHDAPEPSPEARSAWSARRVSEELERELRDASRRALEHAADARQLAALRTDDWVGFELASTSVVVRDGEVQPGSDPWTASLRTANILEFETQRYGDHVLVFALARCGTDSDATFLVRTAEVYRLTAQGWRQCASHANPVPDVLGS